jgi:hypothetical protein
LVSFPYQKATEFWLEIIQGVTGHGAGGQAAAFTGGAARRYLWVMGYCKHMGKFDGVFKGHISGGLIVDAAHGRCMNTLGIPISSLDWACICVGM